MITTTQDPRRDVSKDVSTCTFCLWFGLLVSLLLVVLADLCLSTLRGKGRKAAQGLHPRHPHERKRASSS